MFKMLTSVRYYGSLPNFPVIGLVGYSAVCKNNCSFFFGTQNKF